MTKLRRVMKEKGLTGKALADACGIGCSIVYKYMCGSRPVSRKTAARFASVLKVPPEELLGSV